jgi:hypothetical protein
VDLATFQQLLSPAGQEALQAAVDLSPTEANFLLLFQSFSKQYPPELARAALETAILRQDAVIKFPYAENLYFTREALEQASSHEVSSYRAERYRFFSLLVDLGCSTGSDTFTMASKALTIGIDYDPLRLAMANANLRSLGLSNQSLQIQADLSDPLPFRPRSAALFFDPSRRVNYQRIHSVEQYQPPLSIIKSWLASFPALGVKISPGVNLAEVAGYGAELEFISLEGELKEAVLWFGPLKSAHRRATLLPGPNQLVSDGISLSPLYPTPITEPKAYLFEPDPAVIRSGLVAQLAESINASQMDPEIAYLTATTRSVTPFARSWSIDAWFPFQLKRLRSYMREHNIGHLTVKKRGSPLEPETLIHQLRLKGDEERVLVLTHLRGEPIVLICNAL